MQLNLIAKATLLLPDILIVLALNLGALMHV
jgi:hypothetical protein